MRRTSFYTLIGLLSVASLVYPDSAALLQAKAKLQTLDRNIQTIKHTLTHAHNTQEAMQEALTKTEKEISTNVHQLYLVEQTTKMKQQQIATLMQRINTLTADQNKQQHLLAKHIRARYKMGPYQELKWLLNQENTQEISRIFTFYHYVIKSRQQLINQLDETKKSLSLNQQQLKQALVEQEALQAKINIHQHTLTTEKNHRTQLIQSLEQTIHSKENTLKEYQQNKENLSRLLQSLALQSIPKTVYPFASMQHKLPYPIKNHGQPIEKIQQGITFFAAEGTIVNSIYSGKIVFSDWLKGYGLLIIVDHSSGFMSLYAHNQALFKHKGESVLQGEQVATVGHTGGIKKTGLYFEIRHHGKAIPPLEWLSKSE